MNDVIDHLARSGKNGNRGSFAIAPGSVKNNIDLIAEGRVQVRIPSRPAFEPWARLPTLGGSASRGFLWIPQMNDEVLVAFAEDDVSSAYVLGGLWSTMKRPPATLLNDFVTKKIIRTGLTEALGHEIELDDLQQSVSITTSTKQKITLDPSKIEMTNLAGTVSITLDNLTQTVSINAANKIAFDALTIELTAEKIDMVAADVSISALGPCTVLGTPIKLN